MAAKKEGGKQPIIIKKIKKAHHGHHGGAWKIAYADFVTAMMAFFLLMWLLGSTSKGDLQGISDYFNSPLMIAMAGGSGSGDSSSLLKGGGTDLTRQNGQVKRGENVPENKRLNLQAAKAEMERHDRQVLGALKAKVEASLETNARMAAFRKQIRLDITSEGLRIQIVDEQNRPMFDLGSSRLKDYTRELLREIGQVLNEVDYKISLAGHTDAKPFAGGDRGYSNWELSADRANASRRELIAAGMSEDKIVRVIGLASSVPFTEDLLDAANRRISIVVMNKRASEALRREGNTLAVSSAADVEGAVQQRPAVPAAGLPAPAATAAAPQVSNPAPARPAQ
jgi:chemotaxis protein MotB